MNSFLKLSSALAIALTLTACGGGGGKSNNSGNTPNGNTTNGSIGNNTNSSTGNSTNNNQTNSTDIEEQYICIGGGEIKYGYQLPPCPDPEENSKTLLGIDTNNNGVRDDVEIWIYQTYQHPIERGIFMQSARAYQKVIVDPKKALETTEYIETLVSCESYWRYEASDNNESYELQRNNLEKEISPIQFNTLERHMAYKRYNGELSGGVYFGKKISKDNCEFDSNGFLKAE